MYLTRLILNPRDRQVRRDLADCQQLHARIMSAFPDRAAPPDRAREHFGVLYRIEQHPRSGAIQLLVQSRARPDWSALDELNPRYLLPEEELPGGWRNPEDKAIDDQYRQLASGMELTFRLRANPTRRVGRRDDPLHGKRVELRDEHDLDAWLQRKGENNGFALLSVRMQRDGPGGRFTGDGVGPGVEGEEAIAQVRATPETNVTGWREGRSAGKRDRLTFGSVLFDGRLRIIDAEAFRLTLDRGIGSGKAYGFGLLSVARA